MQIVRSAPGEWANIRIGGLMGMASFSNNPGSICSEFRTLRKIFNNYFEPPSILSMGMSGDYQLALTEGSTMVRIGSLLFGKRE